MATPLRNPVHPRPLLRRVGPFLTIVIRAFVCGSKRYQGTPDMTDQTYLTPEEVTERYRGTISVGTLRNWRSMRIGPAFVKVGKSVLYPVVELETWDRKNVVTCHAAKRLGMRGGDQR